MRSAAGGLLTLAPEAAAAISEQSRPQPRLEQLSAREQTVLELLADGLSNDTIAERLHVSRSTVKFHLCNIFDKLGVNSRAEAIALCYKERPLGAPVLGRVSRLPERRERAMAV